MLRAMWVGVLLVVCACLGPSTQPSATEIDVTTSGGVSASSGGSTDSGGPTPHGVSECAVAGGYFERIAGPHSIDVDFGDAQIWTGLLDAPALAVGTSGLTSILWHRNEDVQRSYLWSVAIDAEYRAAPATLLYEDAKGYGAFAGGGGIVVTRCDEDELAWRILDLDANPIGDWSSPSTYAACTAAPRGAWIDHEMIEMGWVHMPFSGGSGCVGCPIAAHVGSGGDDAIWPVTDYDGEVGQTPNVAVGPSSTVLVTTRLLGYEPARTTQLVVARIDPSGAQLGPPLQLELPPSSTGDSIESLDAAAMADGADGFYVFIGGFGPSMGRLHIDGQGVIDEALAELPVFERVNAYAIYASGAFTITPVPGGAIAIGDAAQHNLVVGLATALDLQGEPAGHLLLPSREIAVADDGERVFLANEYTHLDIYELGCVL